MHYAVNTLHKAQWTQAVLVLCHFLPLPLIGQYGPKIGMAIAKPRG